MLILTRRNGEALCIGEDIVVRVLRTNGRQIVFGIDAPKEIPVHREEIKRLIDAEKTNGE